ncbi:MAG: DUF447 family protein [Candidatus Heimdallarchaeota archaeon]|nr:DUF447 family protein [Candidatus Heimdallarchaeota archaeon]
MDKHFHFTKKVIYETIVSTFTANNEPNAAPMGIFRTEDDLITIRPFVQSDTFQNLLAQDACVVNLTRDPSLFVDCALFQETLPKRLFEKAPKVNAPLLSPCRNNFIALKVVEKTKEGPRATFIGKIVSYKSVSVPFPPITRAFSSILEVLIHATRVLHFTPLKGENSPEVQELWKQIAQHAAIIHRVSPDESIYCQLLDKIQEKLSLSRG